MTLCRTKGESGFTLVEALVALAIVSAMTAAFYQLLSSNIRTGQAAELRKRALLVGQSAMALASVLGPRATEARHGESANLVWEARSMEAPEEEGLQTEGIEIIVSSPVDRRPILALRTVVARP